MEYQVNNFDMPAHIASLHDQYVHRTASHLLLLTCWCNHREVPCALCQYIDERTTSLIYPGRKDCPSGWSQDYWGYMMAPATDQGRGEHTCIPIDAQVDTQICSTSKSLDQTPFYRDRARVETRKATLYGRVPPDLPLQSHFPQFLRLDLSCRGRAAGRIHKPSRSGNDVDDAAQCTDSIVIDYMCPLPLCVLWLGVHSLGCPDLQQPFSASLLRSCSWTSLHCRRLWLVASTLTAYSFHIIPCSKQVEVLTRTYRGVHLTDRCIH